MHARAAQLLGGDILADNRLHNLRAGQEHVAVALDHHHEVRQSGGIDRAARAGTENGGNLRHHAGCQNVALEYLRIARKAVHTLLDTRPAGIVDTDDRCAHLHGRIQHLAYFLGLCFGQGAAVDGEILCEHIDETPVDGAVTGHHAVREVMLLVHAEVGAAMGDEHVHLLKTALVQQCLNPLTGGHLALAVLFLNSFLTASEPCLGTQLKQFLNFILHCHN